MAEYLRQRGFGQGTINNILSHWGEEELEKKVLEIIKLVPDISKAELFSKLMQGKGKGKSHSSADQDSGNLKKGGRRNAGTSSSRTRW